MAKHYYIYTHNLFLRSRKRERFHALVLCHQLREEIGLRSVNWLHPTEDIHVFCGWRKLNKIIEEAHLLGYEDELLIFERRPYNG